MKRKFLFFSIALLGIVFISCTKKTAEGDKAAASSQDAANVTEVTTVEKRENKAPNFSWQDQSGKTVDFASNSGKLTLVNFWATWCGPCKHELPDLIALSKEYESRGVKIIGISADVGTDVIGDVKSFVQEEGIPYQVLIANEEIKEAFGNVSMLPTSFVVDKEGNILETMIGARSKAQFAEALDKHL
jgi:thiol-disulfide isomerase/thioredoxin